MEQQELHLLITRYLARQTSSEENERLATWITESPDHEQLFEQLKAVWQHSAAPAAPAETAAALRRVKARLQPPAPLPHPARQPRPRPKRTFRLLALAVVVLAAAGVLYRHRPLAAPVTYQLRRTAAGQQQTIRLADGSRVTLAPRVACATRSRLPAPTATCTWRARRFSR